MGDLCYIANHTKKIRIGQGKFRELLLDNYGDVLMHLIYKPYASDDLITSGWIGDDIEIVSQANMPKWEKYMEYPDKTIYYKGLYEDSIGVNI